MRTADFDFELPGELIAQTPAAQRDQSRLMVLNRTTGTVEHGRFPDILSFLRAGDVLVLNNSRVVPARLRGVNSATGGRFEILLLEENAVNDWWAMLRPGKRARLGTVIALLDLKGQSTPVRATVVEVNAEGHRRLRFEGVSNLLQQIEHLGEIPLPPYIRRDPAAAAKPGDSDAALESAPSEAEQRTNGSAQNFNDRERYQTVFAQPPGSVAAPTAGLHFTEALLEQVRALGVQVCFVTLHVGLGTFGPVKADTLDAHVMHEERYQLSEETARTLTDAKQAGRRIIAVGTTTVRVLESIAANNDGHLPAISGRTRIFIFPPYEFKIVDALLTNFHLPCSTLLMLVSAFAAPKETRGREMVLAAYAEAIRQRYRFFSYGDAMLLL